MNAKNIFIILVVLFLLGVIAVFLSGFQQQDQTQELAPAGQTPPPAPHPTNVAPRTVYNLSGTLLAMQGDIIRFGANIEQTANGRELIEERVARITSSTKVVRFETVTNPETGKAKVEERPIALSSLQPGDRIQVISNRDIREQEEIQATKIRFLGRE